MSGTKNKKTSAALRTKRGKGRGMLEDDGAGIKKMLANKTRTFWMFQTVGWTGYFLFRLFVSVANSIEMLDYLPLAITATLMGVGLTIVMRYIYRVVRRFSIQTMICWQRQ